VSEEISAEVESYWPVTPRSNSSNKTAVLAPVALGNTVPSPFQDLADC